MLAGEFQTRIEMRQIGVRDEAKLLADYGDCGKPVCCNTHLAVMPPVSMKMAKLQKATLDPTKISGRCGRLKCCLRYEFDTYEQLLREMPFLGSQVMTPERLRKSGGTRDPRRAVAGGDDGRPAEARATVRHNPIVRGAATGSHRARCNRLKFSLSVVLS